MERKLVLHGYVPHDGWGNPIANSGVTISTGIDIGQMSITDLMELFRGADVVWEDLIAKLKPYLGKKRTAAMQFLKDNPLTVTKDEASILDYMMRIRVIEALRKQWFRFTNYEFDHLPDQVQTVLFSLAWNLGENLSIRYPNTWGKFVKGFQASNWTEVYNYLKDFPSLNPELRQRRIEEANVLLPIINQRT